MTKQSHTTSEPLDFRQLQTDFAQHIRNPASNPAPSGIEDRRMAIYRELFYNNIENFISNNFPVLRMITPDVHWHQMIREFMTRHAAKTPLFLEIPQEFLVYLQTERQAQPHDPAFLLELAHYEWMELAVSVAEQEIDLNGIDVNGDLLHAQPALSPLVWPLCYQYPVHKISSDYQPQSPAATAIHLIIYRDFDDEVHFLESNAVTARLLALLAPEQPSALTGEQCLTMIAAELQHPEPELVIHGGLQTLQHLRDKHVILGTYS